MTDFSRESSMKIVPIFSGSFKELDSFLKIVQIVHDSLKTTGMIPFSDFVFQVKLSQNVKTQFTELKTFQKGLKERYTNNTTIPQIHTQLSRMTQNSMSVTMYKDKILTLICDLNNLQIEELPDTTTIA